jgi:hypothetical protein
MSISDDAEERRGEQIDPELTGILRSVAMTLLEPNDQILAFHGGALNYYDKMTSHIINHDPATVDTVLDLTTRLRRTYRTFDEYKRMVDTLPVTKGRREEDDDTTDICPVCHESLNSWKHVVRLRALNGDPRTCGHAMHRTCATQLRPQANMFSCPVCRATLGASLAFWMDMENRVPEF